MDREEFRRKDIVIQKRCMRSKKIMASISAIMLGIRNEQSKSEKEKKDGEDSRERD